MIFVKRILAADIRLRLRSLLRFFVKRAPGLTVTVRSISTSWVKSGQRLLEAGVAISAFIVLNYQNAK